ncbi:putative short chain dehydrogenase/ reductase [Ilyonectria robusta]|uniref:putative short chain dehydrogenase/ reductase n=1 Tax=Ilyonectria robusta TaxID=1079257 RepID=UPI001E8CA1DF|nr:putative short chain dehydrogenase/ reductase [Ilyonectria robusta]KAH8688445.1 putative short chain dehydrogenase/ reductase [Ilyonectria robusta]
MAAYIATQRHDLPLYATTEICSGGTYIVTGANVGLGFEASKHLVALGAAKVIMAVRNISAGEAAKAKIEEATGTTGVAEVWVLDLASYDSVKAFAKKAETELERIDALIENAAVAMAGSALPEGHLAPITVNVLSTLLLGVLLLPKMSEIARKFNIEPKLAFVSSTVGFDAKEDWDNVKDDPLRKISADETLAMKIYPLSKLMESFAIRQLAAINPVARTGVVINFICPGLCKTELSRDMPQAVREKFDPQLAQHGRTAEDGSRTLLAGAVAGKESHGRLMDSCEIDE